ncbi:hypothetical protein PGB34_15490 [Xenophilus arseniciresistens]|uniref:Tetratricopeptide repeat protein n=1 Tax=Xenophilus arseniciresistens TaxID=1283306 RepID=A0AAE3N9S0_9BURK|nr:hypothetical protein [Xenophilus arseniciresistens]MDA7417766.1 hypothetical protein [Xenophilus arseniciresistens]
MSTLARSSPASALPLLTPSEAQRLRPEAWLRSTLTPPRRFGPEQVRALWPELHPSETTPPDTALLPGWAAFHNGDFAQAAALAQAQGPAGQALLNQSTATYACYVEPRDATRLALLRQVATRAQEQLQAQPEDPGALYWLAFALGRHAQAVSVARALAKGLGNQIKTTLEQLLAVQPGHADAHFALGTFHAEVIDKVGALVGRMTYGVHADAAQALFERGLTLNPRSIMGRIEYARALLALHGQERLDEATRLYEAAAAIEPLDMRTRLDQELARQSLQD